MPAPASTLERASVEDAQHAPPHPASAGAAPHFDLVTTRAAFDALETDWNSLFARGGRDTQLFQTFNWLWHWANHYLPHPDAADAAGPKLAIVTARIADRLVLVWPMVSERVGPITQLSWMGAPVSQYGDILVDPDMDALALMRSALPLIKARCGGDVLRLRKVRQDSVVACLLQEIGARTLSEDRAPYLTLSSTPDAEERQLSSATRRKRRSKRRKLEEQGTVGFVHETAGAGAEALIDTTFRLKRAWLKSRGLISPAFGDPRTQRFFADLARDATHRTGIHVQAMTCGGQPVALDVALVCKGRHAVHISAYDPAFERFSVGQLHWEDSIRRARADGCAVFDFLAPGDAYKLEWTNDAVAVRDWAFATSLAGHTYAVVWLGVLRTVGKRSLDRMPVGARRRIAETLGRVLGHRE